MKNKTFLFGQLLCQNLRWLLIVFIQYVSSPARFFRAFVSNPKVFVMMLVVILTATFPVRAFAHVLKADGDIGAVIHINPEDDPIVGQPATFLFDFKDKTGRFSPAACDCTVTIAKQGQEVFSQPLGEAGSSEALSPFFQYTFPEKAVYTLVVTGQPKTPNAFQPFTLRYDLRIEREQGGSVSDQTPNHFWHYLIFVGGFLAFFVAIFVGRKKGRAKISAKAIAALVIASGYLFMHAHVSVAATHDAGHVASAHECCLAQPTLAVSSLQSVLTIAKHAPFEAALIFQDIPTISVGISRAPPV